jgi:hypothetical protein
MPDGDVISRVRKILTLAGDTGATEGERQAATEAAARLMTRYRIEQADLDAADDGPQRIDVVAEDLGAFGRPQYWALDLVTAIGQTMTVDAVFVEDAAGDREVTLIGRPNSVAWVGLMYRWLRPQLEHDARVIVTAERSYRVFMGRPATPDEIARYREGFYAGAIQRIAERIEDAQRAERGYGQALVVSERAALDAYYGDDAPRRVDTSREIDREAAISGYRAGDRADLRPDGRLDGGTRQLQEGT